MDRIGSGDLGGADDRGDVQVAAGALGGPDAHVLVGKPHVQRVLDVALHELPFVLGGDLVHQLHGLDDTEHLVLSHGVADLHERGGAGLGRAIERADDRRFHDRELDLAVVFVGGSNRG
jgi:hypothetical protein